MCRETQGFPEHWQVAFRPDKKAISSASIHVPAQEGRAAARHKTHPDGSKPSDIQEPDRASIDDDDRPEGTRDEPATKSDALSRFMEDPGNYFCAHTNEIPYDAILNRNSLCAGLLLWGLYILSDAFRQITLRTFHMKSPESRAWDFSVPVISGCRRYKSISSVIYRQLQSIGSQHLRVFHKGEHFRQETKN